MISKHRNRGIIQLAFAMVLTGVLIFMWRKGAAHLRLRQVSDGWMIFWFFLYLGTVTLWMVGSFSLAKAKGYGTDMMGGLFMFLFLLGFCIPLAPFVFPGFVIFGLKDKTRKRKRWH
jgi:cytochrome bd-type quinol oxidase subunit 2